MPSGLMNEKRGLVMGVANDHSIAWGIAKALAAEGAELAFTYQGEALGKRVAPLAETLGSEHVMSCDVEDIGSVNSKTLKAAATQKVAAKLLKAGLVSEIKARSGKEIWRRDEETGQVCVETYLAELAYGGRGGTVMARRWPIS